MQQDEGYGLEGCQWREEGSTEDLHRNMPGPDIDADFVFRWRKAGMGFRMWMN